MPKDDSNRDPLGEERQYYLEIETDLLERHSGKFALIKGRKLLGTFDTAYAAYKEGLKKLGNAPMLIVQIQEEEPKEWLPALQLGLIDASIQG